VIQIRTLEHVDGLRRVIEEDKKKLSRFPVRFILVQDPNDWDKLLIILKERAGHVFRLSEYCVDSDSMPDLNRFKRDIQRMEQGDMLIVPLSEYLRLFGDKHGLLKQLAGYSKSDGVIGGTRDRIYVPLYNVEMIFYNEMRNVSRFGVQGEGPECFEMKKRDDDYAIRLNIMSNGLHGSPMASSKVEGLKQFFQLWEKKAPTDLCLVTQFSDYICESVGAYGINVYRNTFQLLEGKLIGYDILQEEWGNDDQWGWLHSLIRERETIDDVMTREFNVVKLDLYDILMDWNEYDEEHKWLAWLACKTKRPYGYIKYAVDREGASFDTFVNDMIFTMIDLVKMSHLKEEETRDIIKQRKQLLERMGMTSLSQEFWDKLDELPNDISRLKCLTGILDEEKCMIVETVGKLISGGQNDEWADVLSIIYPELYHYLNNVDYGNELATAYFVKYKRAKVCDEVTDDMRCVAREIKDRGLLWQYTTRYEFLGSFAESDLIYWADGVGAEWLGLIEGMLKHKFHSMDIKYDYEYKVARANLPTTTEFNKDWQDMGTTYKEYKNYDILAHSYNCKYPKYLVDEFQHISDFVRNAVSLLGAHDVVIITADHGTSRLAAIDKNPSIDAPMGLVRKHGRYCENDGSLCIEDYPSCIEDSSKIIFADYNRFKSSGNVSGEIHGGATLEEALVPVIVLRKGAIKKDIRLSLVSSTIRLNVQGEAKLAVRVEGDLEKLTMLVENESLIFENKGDGTWEATVKGMTSGNYTATLLGDGKNLGNVEFTLTKGLTENDLGLRGY